MKRPDAGKTKRVREAFSRSDKKQKKVQMRSILANQRWLVEVPGYVTLAEGISAGPCDVTFLELREMQHLVQQVGQLGHG